MKASDHKGAFSALSSRAPVEFRRKKRTHKTEKAIPITQAKHQSRPKHVESISTLIYKINKSLFHAMGSFRRGLMSRDG